jgi:hypothetical protein
LNVGFVQLSSLHAISQNNLAHEFLIAEVIHNSTPYYIRIERSTKKVVTRRKWLRTSSSIAAVADAVRVARSTLMLTAGMDRGELYQIATLPLRLVSYPLSEFCLLLSMFCLFSPEYKLMAEQCYWFANVILKAVQQRCPTSTIIKEKNYDMAGKYGAISVPQSSSTRSSLIRVFEVLASFRGIHSKDLQLEWWASRTDTIDFLLHFLSSFPIRDWTETYPVTTEVQRRAADALVYVVPRGQPTRSSPERWR